MGASQHSRRSPSGSACRRRTWSARWTRWSTPVSLYEPVYTDGGDPLTVMDQVRDVKNTDEQWLESIALRQAMQDLSERERRILALRFYDGRTQMEVAGSLGISQAQVSRLEKGALASIRKAIRVS